MAVWVDDGPPNRDCKNSEGQGCSQNKTVQLQTQDELI